MHATLQDRDMVVLVAVVLILVAIILVCCKQSVPAAIIVVFVVMFLGLAMDSNSKIVIKETPVSSRVNKNKNTLPKQLSNSMPQLPLQASMSMSMPMQAQRFQMGAPHHPVLNSYLDTRTPIVPVGVYNSVMNQAVPRMEGDYCGRAALGNEENTVPVKDITITNVPVLQNNPPSPTKKCSINSAYTEFNPPEMASSSSNTYQDLYVLPTEISRPLGKSVAEVQAKTKIKCIKKEMNSFPKPDRMQGNDVFMGEDAPIQIELAKLEQQQASNSVITQPSGSSTLNAALDVSPAERPSFNFVKPLPDYDKDMKRKIRNEGLYGIQGDLNCVQMRRSAVADTGFIQPLEARQEHLRYLAYDMPNYRNQWQTARANTVNSDTRYFK
jgi:hypothetical protein